MTFTVNEYDYITYDAMPMMDYGFIDIAKNAWPDNYVDSYNQHTKNINNIKPHQKGSMNDADREKYLDWRHKYYVEVMCRLTEENNKKGRENDY